MAPANSPEGEGACQLESNTKGKHTSQHSVLSTQFSTLSVLMLSLLRKFLILLQVQKNMPIFAC